MVVSVHEDKQKIETVAYRLQEHRHIGVDNFYESKQMPIIEQRRLFARVNHAHFKRSDISLAV